MHIITERRLREFAQQHPDPGSSLSMWTTIARKAAWVSIQQVRSDWPSADPAGKLTVFNIAGNKYRLIVYIDYRSKIIFIRHVLTHAEYSKERWKRDPWY
jgi:mRNA interferase HigB